MFGYEFACSLTELVEEKLKYLQSCIDSLDDSFKFLDFVNEILGVSDYLGTLSSDSDEIISCKVKNEVNDLQIYFTDIIDYINGLKSMNLKIPPTKFTIYEENSNDQSIDKFLKENFPPISPQL